MSKNQEQMKELINDVRTGKTDKEVLCKEIQKDVNCLIYPVFGEDYKKLSPRAIIDICTNLDSIDVNKNIMRQIATRVSVFMFNLIDNSTIKIDDDYEYEYGRIKEDKELFDIIKDNSRIFKDFKAYDNAPDNIKSLSRVQTIMMELYGYEMHSVDEIETLLDIDSAFILKLIAMMKDNILGISSVVENMSDYASFDEKETDDSDIKIYGAEQKAAETEAADEYEAYEPENADLPDNESDEGIENDESDDEDSDEGVLFEYDMNGYENNDFDDVPVRGVSLMDKLTAFVGRVFPGVPRARRRNVVYASMVVILVVIILIVSIAAMAGGNRRKANNKNNSNEWKPMEYTTKAPKETATSKDSSTAAHSSRISVAESTSSREETTAANERTIAEDKNNKPAGRNDSDNTSSGGDVSTDKPLGGDDSGDNKPAGGDDSGDNKPAGGDDSGDNKPAGGDDSGDNKPAGGDDSGDNKPAGGDDSGDNKPAGGDDSGDNKPAGGDDSGDNKPAGGDDSGDNKPAGGDDSGDNKPAGGDDSGDNKPAGGDDSSNTPAGGDTSADN